MNELPISQAVLRHDMTAEPFECVLRLVADRQRMQTFVNAVQRVAGALPRQRDQIAVAFLRLDRRFALWPRSLGVR